MNFEELVIKLGYRSKCKNCGHTKDFRMFFYFSVIMLVLMLILFYYAYTYEISEVMLHNKCVELSLDKCPFYKNGSLTTGGFGSGIGINNFNGSFNTS